MLRNRATGLGSVCAYSSCDPRRRGARYARGTRPLSNALPGSVAFCIARIGLSGRPARGAALYSVRAGKAIGMATVSFSIMPRWSLFALFANAWQHSRWMRAKAICERCVVCGSDLENDAMRLLREGHLRSAVFSSRLQLELTLLAICDDIGMVEGHQKSFQKGTAEAFVDFMRTYRWIDRPEGRRIRSIYAKASKIVHGGAVTYYRARSIICEVRDLIESLDGAKAPAVTERPLRKHHPAQGPLKVIAGFNREPLSGFQLVNAVAEGGAL
jgi:hypothetical protein